MAQRNCILWYNMNRKGNLKNVFSFVMYRVSQNGHKWTWEHRCLLGVEGYLLVKNNKLNFKHVSRKSIHRIRKKNHPTISRSPPPPHTQHTYGYIITSDLNVSLLWINWGFLFPLESVWCYLFIWICWRSLMGMQNGLAVPGNSLAASYQVWCVFR